MTDAERRLLDAIDMNVPWDLVETFATRPRVHPTDVNDAADLIAERLRAHGVPVTMHAPTLYLTIPHHAEVRAEGATFGGKAPAGCADARDGVHGPLTYVPAGFASGSDDVFDTFDAQAAARSDVAGKIAITEGFASPATVTNLARLGALAVIAINPGADAHWGTCTSVWGTPGVDEKDGAPHVPAINVNRPDGDALKARAERGESATVAVTMESGWFESKVPEVRIEGTESDDFVLLHGHYDSWDVGVGDNATGDATLLEVARLLYAHRHDLKRGVRIAWWPGHSTGRYAGSTWYADAFAVDLVERCVAQVNCDSPGCRWATEYKDVSLTADTEAFAARVIEDAVGQPLHAERAHQAGDYSFNNLGLSGYFMLLSTMPDDVRAEKGYYGVGGCGGNIAWHTEHDTLEVADRDILEKDVRIYLLAVYRNATAPTLPLDFRATVRGFLATIQRYQAAAGNAFDLGPAGEAAQALLDRLDELAQRIDAGDLPAPAVNDLLKRLSRDLIALDYTTRPRFDHDPALTIPPLPDLADAERLDTMTGDDRRFATTSLLRGRNRVVATLRAARVAVDAVLA
ncbi:MAG: M28 family peptidase [Trueperaceae bacterium]|nr:M28 family peptidase [Trueperaceae bacterium]